MNRQLSAVWLGLILIALPANSQDASIPPQKPVTEVRADFLKLLDRPRVPLDVTTQELKPTKGLTQEKVSFAVEKRPDGSIERVPALVIRPDWAKVGEKLPAVLVLHGTGGNKEGNRGWLEQLANRGFLAIAIDGRFHGERNGGATVGTKAYNEAITRAWRSKPGDPQAHPFYYDTCWDIWRTIDYLTTRPDVDPERIGLIGISKGGIETWLAASVDERVKVAVPAISVQSFRWSLEHERYQARANTIKEAHEAAASDLGEPVVNARVCRELWAKIIPGILDEFDGPSMLRLFSSRSLLILNGDRDPNCPLPGAEIAFASARTAFHEAHADDHLKIMVARDSGHTVTKEQHDAALDWFVTWLKPTQK